MAKQGMGSGWGELGVRRCTSPFPSTPLLHLKNNQTERTFLLLIRWLWGVSSQKLWHTKIDKIEVFPNSPAPPHRHLLWRGHADEKTRKPPPARGEKRIVPFWILEWTVATLQLHDVQQDDQMMMLKNVFVSESWGGPVERGGVS